MVAFILGCVSILLITLLVLSSTSTRETSGELGLAVNLILVGGSLYIARFERLKPRSHSRNILLAYISILAFVASGLIFITSISYGDPTTLAAVGLFFDGTGVLFSTISVVRPPPIAPSGSGVQSTAK